MSVISRLTRRAMNYKHYSRFGFIEMSTKEEGAAAIEKFNGQELGGRTLKVNEAKQRENRVGF